MNQTVRGNSPSAVGAIFFFALYVLLFFAIWWAKDSVSLREPWRTELLAFVWFVLTVAAARIYDGGVFTRRYWHGSGVLWKGVAAVLALELFQGHIKWPGGPYFPYAVAAITFGPVTEEIVRTVMLNAMEARWGGAWAIGVTSFLFAMWHPFFWAALIQCVLLGVITLRSHKSLPCALAAHYAMNLIAVGAVPWVFHWLQLKLL